MGGSAGPGDRGPLGDAGGGAIARLGHPSVTVTEAVCG